MKKYLGSWWVVLMLVGGGVSRGDSTNYIYNLARQPLNFATNFDVVQFDTGLGSLTSVAVRVTGAMYADLGVQNTWAGGSNWVSATLFGEWAVVRPADLMVLSEAAPRVTVEDVGLAPFDGIPDYTPEDGQTFLGVWADDMHWSEHNDVSLLAFFSGAGTVALQLQASVSGFEVLGEVGKTAEGVHGNEEGVTEIEIVYSYQAIPEPSTLILALFGGCAVWTRWRRRA